ncbi:MAG: hypothetical protein CMJ64_05765 [Planctomycetaceae bacterium]|nr:hypothetical protein [Planctomycetaceae bacterium]
MSELTVMRGYVYSSLGTDLDLGELVELFVSEIPARVAKLEEAWDSRDWDSLGRAAHQLKGAAGSYGFEELTPSLRKLDHSVRMEKPEEEIDEALAEARELCSRVRASGPE